MNELFSCFIGWARATTIAVALALTVVPSQAMGDDAFLSEDLNLIPEEESMVIQSIVTSGAEYDPTRLTKFIPGSAFVPLNQSGQWHDAFEYTSGGCIYPDSSSGGSVTTGYASIELPDGALLLSATALVYDSDSGHVEVSLRDVDVTATTTLVVGGGVSTSWSKTDEGILVSDSTDGTPGWDGLYLDVDPDVIVGSIPGTFVFSRIYHLVGARVNFSRNDAGSNLQLCGLLVSYQVPATGDNQTFTPLEPCRIFDSRPGNGGSGKLAANETRTLAVSGDTSLGGQAGEGDCGVPTAATAVQVNFVAVNPDGYGSLKLWATGDPEPAGLLAYHPTPNFWNGSGVVPVALSAGQKSMDIKANGQGTHVYIAVTGYMSPVSNMGN